MMSVNSLKRLLFLMKLFWISILLCKKFYIRIDKYQMFLLKQGGFF